MDTNARILDHLKHNHTASAAELSHALNLTKADIHHHLRKLLGAGKVEVIAAKSNHGVGRPARRYKRVHVPPIRLTRLLMSVLLEPPSYISHSDAPVISLPERIAYEILNCCPATRSYSSSPAVRLNHLVDELKGFGVDFRWEARKSGPQFFFDHEPFSDLIEDASLVRQILAALIDQIQKDTA